MGKQVKTPRFYVDMVTFLHATGDIRWGHGAVVPTLVDNKGGAELLYMNCSNPFLRMNLLNPETAAPFAIGHQYGLFTEFPQWGVTEENMADAKTSFPINFCALLNHNLGSEPTPFLARGFRRVVDEIDGFKNQARFLNHSDHNPVEVLNAASKEGSVNGVHESQKFIGPEYNGTTIFTFDTQDSYWTGFDMVWGGQTNGDDRYDYNHNHQLGSFVVGKYWDAPNSPDLSLTMSRRFDGIKKQKTIGGKTLANIYYDGPTEWTMNRTQTDIYKYPPFELDGPNNITNDTLFDKRAKSGLGRKGLRSWNLTFSYISESDMWTDYESSNTSPFDDSGYNSEIGGDAPIDPDQRRNPMLSDESFNFVWNCTLGGTLPFIFQPDNDNNNPDQFSICTFRSNTLSVKQVAFNTYSLSVTIDEVA